MKEGLSFSALKRSRGSVEQLAKAIESNSREKREDERFWELTVDKAGNGHAVIRFLPAPPQDGEDGLPWVRTFSHGFKGPGGWLIDQCPTTIEQKCPVCESNSLLWNSEIEANKKVASSRKRRLSYTANILVVTDPANPKNDGQVKLFRFGQKIFDKIYEKMNPDPAFGESPVNPFDLWCGMNFKLRARLVAGYRNYDSSEFAMVTAVSEDDTRLEALWKSEHGLLQFLDVKNFKSFDQIKKRLGVVLGSAVVTETAEKAPSQRFSDEDAGIKLQPEVNNPVETTGDEEPDDLSFFKNIADSE